MRTGQNSIADSPIPNAQKRVAIFGGTFDPVHWGHLSLARAASKVFQLNAVVWIPSFCPPHKSQGVSPYVHRAAMVRAAIASYPEFELFEETPPDRLETTTPNYAIETFGLLQKRYGDREWYWLLGSDAFSTLPRWYQRHRLIPAIAWLVAPRPSRSVEQVESACSEVVRQLEQQGISIRWHLFPAPYPHISSTQIRQAYRQSQSCFPPVPESVRTYIATHQLYQTNFCSIFPENKQ